VRFLVDDIEVSRTQQSPRYPMQLMLNFYDLAGNSPAGEEVAWFDIDFVRAYERDGQRAERADSISGGASR